MQTFLPYDDFQKSAKCLDRLRLGKQRVEAWQILETLLHGSRWRNHPAVRMWDGHLYWLREYSLTICSEWKRRGYKDIMYKRLSKYILEVTEPPSWLGSMKFHASHRAALLAKYPSWYNQFGWKEKPVIEYVWPVSRSMKYGNGPTGASETRHQGW